MSPRRRAMLLASAVVSAAVVGGCGGGDEPGQLSIVDARIGEPVGPNAALYFTVDNPGPETAIVAVRTTAGRRTAMHDHVMEDGAMVMREIEGALELPVGRTVLEPGGMHVMLIDAAGLAVGETVPVTVVMVDGTTLALDADVVALDELLEE